MTKLEKMAATSLARLFHRQGMPMERAEALGDRAAVPVVAAIEATAFHAKHIPTDAMAEAVFIGIQELDNLVE